MVDRFMNTNALLKTIDNEVKRYSIDNNSEIINNYVVKIGIILFSAEMENALKEFISKKLAGYKAFCQLCRKLTNPKFGDINDALKDLKLQPIKIDDSEITNYSNVMQTRDKIAHQLNPNIQISLQDFKNVLATGMKILTEVDKITST